MHGYLNKFLKEIEYLKDYVPASSLGRNWEYVGYFGPWDYGYSFKE